MVGVTKSSIREMKYNRIINHNKYQQEYDTTSNQILDWKFTKQTSAHLKDKDRTYRERPKWDTMQSMEKLSRYSKPGDIKEVEGVQATILLEQKIRNEPTLN